ncbi:MAG: hypothetical protein AB7E68_03465 [Candidatus Babeliales bacterium]
MKRHLLVLIFLGMPAYTFSFQELRGRKKPTTQPVQQPMQPTRPVQQPMQPVQQPMQPTRPVQQPMQPTQGQQYDTGLTKGTYRLAVKTKDFLEKAQEIARNLPRKDRALGIAIVNIGSNPLRLYQEIKIQNPTTPIEKLVTDMYNYTNNLKSYLIKASKSKDTNLSEAAKELLSRPIIKAGK